MDYPFFKAFPTDWEIMMRKAGVPPAHRGNLYRLIFFAWQEQGLDLTEDETYPARMKMLAQAFGLALCRFKVYLEYYKRISEQDEDGRWLPSCLLSQLQNAMAAMGAKQKKAAPAEEDGKNVSNFQPDFMPPAAQLPAELEQTQNRVRTESEQSQNRVRTESEQSQNRVRTESEQNQNNFRHLSPLLTIPL